MRYGIIGIGVLTLALGFGSVALAGGKNVQNHHCVKDGATLEGKTKKECKKEGGKWEKDAADKAAAGGAKPAPTEPAAQ